MVTIQILFERVLGDKWQFWAIVLQLLGQPEPELTYYVQHRNRKSQESYTSECDSGVGPDSAESSRMPSMEGHPGISADSANSNNNLILYSWMVEECILAAYSTKYVSCPIHFDIPLSLVAPDTVSFFNLFSRII